MKLMPVIVVIGTLTGCVANRPHPPVTVDVPVVAAEPVLSDWWHILREADEAAVAGDGERAQELLAHVPTEEAGAAAPAEISGKIALRAGDLVAAMNWFKAASDSAPDDQTARRLADLMRITRALQLQQEGDTRGAAAAIDQITDRRIRGQLRDSFVTNND